MDTNFSLNGDRKLRFAPKLSGIPLVEQQSVAEEFWSNYHALVDVVDMVSSEFGRANEELPEPDPVDQRSPVEVLQIFKTKLDQSSVSQRRKAILYASISFAEEALINAQNLENLADSPDLLNRYTLDLAIAAGDLALAWQLLSQISMWAEGLLLAAGLSKGITAAISQWG